MDSQANLFARRPATAARPLLGVTALIVEDSRYASEAVRMLCQRSGARIRRAPSLMHADRHLKVYRPCVVLIDLGLPDGSGLDLIRQLANTTPRVDVILGTSGDDHTEAAVMAAGADGFLPKPVSSLAAFQTAILNHLPADRQPPGPRLISDETIQPDTIAFQDDLCNIATSLRDTQATVNYDYITQFLGGVARSARDDVLRRAVDDLARSRAAGENTKHHMRKLAAVVEDRIAEPCIR